MRRLGALLALAAESASAEEGAAAGAQEAASAPVVPSDLAERVRFAEERGRALYEHDQAAWHGTDAAKPASRRWKRQLVGWITAPRAGARPLVRLLSEPAPGEFASRVDADVGVTAVTLAEHDPPLALPEDEQALARGRALAIRERKRQCTRSLNSVVLRDASGEIHVYLLAASAKRDEVVLAGHDLARLSADGRELIAWRPFSNGCLVGKRREGDALLFVTHVLDPAPTETHVFTSLNHGVRLFVATARGIWSIQAGEIRLVEETAEESP